MSFLRVSRGISKIAITKIAITVLSQALKKKQKTTPLARYFMNRRGLVTFVVSNVLIIRNWFICPVPSPSKTTSNIIGFSYIFDFHIESMVDFEISVLVLISGKK